MGILSTITDDDSRLNHSLAQAKSTARPIVDFPILREDRVKCALVALLLIGISFLNGGLGLPHWNESGLAPLIWVPSGIALATIVLFGNQHWPWVTLGTFLTVWISRPESISAALTVAVGSTIKALLGASLITRIFSEKLTFTKVSEVFGLLVIVMIFSNFVGAFLEVGGLILVGIIPKTSFFVVARSWWLSQALGDLIVGALLINAWNDSRFRMHLLFTRGWEIASLTAMTILVSGFIFTTLVVQQHSFLIQPYYLFALILWTALRFDLMGTLFANAVIIVMAEIGISQGFSPFLDYDSVDRMVVFQIFLSTLSLIGLLVAASVREKTEALDARNDFLGIASHELKTPITSLKMNLQLLRKKIQKKCDKSDDEMTYLHSLSKVDGQINRLVAIVEQLLDVSQVERNKFELHREDLDLSVLIQNLLERLSGTLTVARCTVETKLAPNAFGKWDLFRIEQVIENLLINAIKYAPGKPIRVETIQSGEITEISVRDQGPGIDESKRPLIFNRFVRANKNLHVPGLGLGLFLTREIVRAHGGDITVESSPGVGARFIIRIPTQPLTS